MVEQSNQWGGFPPEGCIMGDQYALLAIRSNVHQDMLIALLFIFLALNGMTLEAVRRDVVNFDLSMSWGLCGD